MTVETDAALLAGDRLFARGDLSGAAVQYRAGGSTVSAAAAWRLGRLQQISGLVDRALRTYDIHPAADDAPTDATSLLAWRATAHFVSGHRDLCRADAQAAAELAEQVDEPAVLAVVHTALALLAALEGDRRANEEHYDTALRYAVTAGDAMQSLRIQVNQGSRLLEEGNYQAAAGKLEEALTGPDAGNFSVLSGLGLTNRAEVFLRLGRLDEATSDLRQASTLFKANGSPMAAHALSILGEVHRVRGDLVLARLAYEEALTYREPSGDTQAALRSLVGMALVDVEDDQLGSAANHLRLAENLDPGLGSVRLHLAWGRVHYSTGNRGFAAERANLAVSEASRNRDKPGLAEAIELRAALEPDRTKPLLRQAMTVWRQVDDPVGIGRTELRLAAVSEPVEAIELTLAAQERLRFAGARELARRAADYHSLVVDPPTGVLVRSLGAFSVQRDGQAITSAQWGSRKPRDLLKLLVSTRGRSITRDQIIDALWPDEDTAACSGRLSVALSVLRKLLSTTGDDASEPLITERQAVRLNTAEVQVDVELFVRLAVLGTRRFDADEPEAVATLQSAEALYRGDFLSEDLYADWAEATREETRQIYGAVLRRLARSAAIAGDTDAALRHYLRLLELDTFDEGAHEGLIRELANARRHGEARRRYTIYRRCMQEVGVAGKSLHVLVEARDATWRSSRVSGIAAE